PPYMLTLAHAGRWDEVKELMKTETDVRQRDLFQILATAATDGTDAGLRELGAVDAAKRREYGGAVGQALMQLRRYPEAAAFFEAATKGAADAAKVLPLVKGLRKVDLHERLLDVSPRGILLQLMAGMMSRDWKAVERLLAPEVLDGDEEESMSSFSLRGKPGVDESSPII